MLLTSLSKKKGSHLVVGVLTDQVGPLGACVCRKAKGEKHVGDRSAKCRKKASGHKQVPTSNHLFHHQIPEEAARVANRKHGSPPAVVGWGPRAVVGRGPHAVVGRVSGKSMRGGRCRRSGSYFGVGSSREDLWWSAGIPDGGRKLLVRF
ncbi:unnamed protein product [Linum trigynum]|uniref:Uncharacterized protein n=1 Tax=Linum trigynum TaxID=586398 RepID=A0AAV2F9I4_9ROSI